MAVVMQAVTIAVPRDVFVASLLSHSPDRWTITVDASLEKTFPNHDIKQALVTALSKRARFVSDIYMQSFWEGTVLIILSIIGLIREQKIRKMTKTIESARRD